MRIKALLVDALAGVQGPSIHLERGVWEIDTHPFVQVELETGKMESLNGVVRIVGPARVKLNVDPEYTGSGVHSQARHVEP